ncbi:FAD-binding protein, partial [Streptomyces olivochromogenes]|uniref:FAD-binding protein n=1 Tax=Streptomyces olivochromogenes TaxID=1963 RepID=UPI0036D9BD90
MSTDPTYVDVLVVGAGPAGLAAAHALRDSALTTLVVDGGKPVAERERDLAADMTRGHGGAGLFSDGKFSFYPSASRLWSLPGEARLRAAYEWTCSVLGAAGLDTPPFPEDPEAYAVGTGEWVLKEYPSYYLSLQARLDLSEKLVTGSGADFLTRTEVTALRHIAEEDRFEAELQDESGGRRTLITRRVILANGRFGPLGLTDLFTGRAWRRLEVGFRIEQSAQSAFFGAMTQLDPKFRFRSEDGRVEWRTFCACREGEAVTTLTEGLWTVSGRADCPPTGRSNIGFNTRILDEEVAKRALTGVLRATRSTTSAFNVTLDDFLAARPAADSLTEVYGEELAAFMREGVTRLAKRFPEVTATEARLIGPTMEGVGWYPEVRSDLRLVDKPAWVAGDSCGLFRGIVAAMISGHYAGAGLRAAGDAES